MKTILSLAAVAALSLSFCTPAMADWDIDSRNAQVDETNFIVGEGCSGTLIDLDDRLILTAYHCIGDAVTSRTIKEADENGILRDVTREELRPVSVSQIHYDGYTLVSSAQFVTTIVGHNKSRDLALLQIKADDIPAQAIAPLLPMDGSVQRSEIVWIVGNPLGLDASISMGTISSVSRAFRLPWTNGQEVPLIQFDAAGEPGSSGGSLYNNEGQLIGVVIAGMSKQMFAVPIESVRDFLVEKGWLPNTDGWGVKPKPVGADGSEEPCC